MSNVVKGQSWIPSQARWLSAFQKQASAAKPSKTRPEDLPVMPLTMLGLELLVQEPCIDLHMASELVLCDLGATIQVLRLIGHEYVVADESLIRMDECLASLDVHAWFPRVSARTIAGIEDTQAATLWKHSRVIAQYARLVAESLGGMAAEEAYLIGLLHDVDAIPEALGWPLAEKARFRPAEFLPPFVQTALRDVKKPGISVWKFVLAEAHHLAGVEQR